MTALVKKWNKAVDGVEASENAYNALTNSADPDMIEQWRSIEEKALASRAYDISAMDVYEAEVDECEP